VDQDHSRHLEFIAAGYSNFARKCTRLINYGAQVCAYRRFLLVIYSLGLRISEGLPWKVSDIDGSSDACIFAMAKGRQDPHVPICRR